MNWTRPLLFTPVYQTRVWGGRELENLFARTLPDATLPYGESWEVSDRPEAPSLLREPAAENAASLHDLWMHHRAEVFGEKLTTSASPRYPLLMKILDAREDLSIQVHPPAEVAPSLHGEPKTEMWFIAHAEPGAKLYAGLKSGVDRAAFEKALAEGTVAEVMHVIEPRAGDCIFLPSGRVHAIGAGLVIFEIQQNSDTTYRVFDWNRTGLDGKPRELHVRESLLSIHFDDAEPAPAAPQPDGTLVSCEYFQVSRGKAAPDATLGTPGEHLVIALVQGALTSAGVALKTGDFALIPAAMSAEARLPSAMTEDAVWLEIRIP